jgi:ATP synthase protein I
MSTPAPASAWADRPVKAARTGLLVTLGLIPLAALVGLLAAGQRGALGAALGCLVPAFVLLLTWTAAELGARRSATAFAASLMASYLVKLVVVAVLLAVLRDVQGADRTALGVSAVAGLLLALVVEARVITSTRAPYVEPTPRRGDPHAG